MDEDGVERAVRCQNVEGVYGCDEDLEKRLYVNTLDSDFVLMAPGGSRKRKNDYEDDTNSKKARLTTRPTDVVTAEETMEIDIQHTLKNISRTDIEREDDEAIREILHTLKRLVVTVQDDLNVLPLETAMSLLRRELENETHPKEARSIIHHHLRRALLTRYSFFGVIEDLGKCFSLEDGTRFIVTKGTTGRDIERVEGVQCAIQLIDECRKGVDIAALDDIIWIAEETIRLYTEGKRVLQQAELLILLGNALVMRHINGPGDLELTYAANKFRQADYLCGGNVPLGYISLTALAHIGWIRATECGNEHGLADVSSYMGKAQSLDEEGARLFQIGAKMAKEVVEMSQLQQLHDAIDRFTTSLSCRMLPHPQRPATLNMLAGALSTRFEWRGDLKDLEDSIALNREGLRLGSHQHPDHSLWLNNLANSLSTRFDQKGAFQDLDECILLHQEALDLRPPPHPLRDTSFNNLANSLSTRFDQKGASQDLEECILLHREALDLRPPPHPLRDTSLNNLAAALSARFQQKGAFQDLEECILLHREALDLRPPPHPDRSTSLNNLANALFTRFEQKGAFQDLEECILLHREALDLLPPSHPHRSTSLNNLAGALSRRFEQKGAFQDLEECILLHREALVLLPSPHPHRSGSLNNLAISLSTRFQQKGAFQDLEECILLHREALDLRPSPHPDRSTSLNNLAGALSRRFEQKEASQDFEQSILLYQEALDLHLSPHPHRSKTLNNLASLHLSRYRQTNDNTDLEQALCSFETASRYETGSLLDRLKTTQRWAVSARAHQPSAALNAYRYVLELLPLLASVDLTIKQRSDVLEHSRGVIGDAAQWAISQSDLENAVVFLSTGRSTFWSQTLQLRTAVDEVAAVDSNLAQKYMDVTRTLEQASHIPEQRFNMKPAPDVHASRQIGVDSLSTLANERRQVMDKIRRIPGFEEFLLPPSFQSLQLAAHNGPVVLLNASQYGCDALILRGSNHVKHVALSATTLASLNALKLLTRRALAGGLRSMEYIQPEILDAITALQGLLHRDMYLDLESDSIASEDLFQFVLMLLWVVVVRPVVVALNLEKSSPPTHIWWCPSGAFTSLPIHAAGMYLGNKEIDCLFQYAVSSYITSPQDLLHPLPQISPAYKITAIIEPEASGGAPLPAARDELQRIKARVPDPNQLIARVWTETRNQIDDVISDIQQSSIVHFGCHGKQNLGSPLDSCLLLSGGRLTMSKIIKECQTSNTAALAYLSACETAKGDEKRPDESLNLVATMMFAGFRSVVGTMWSIFDYDAPIVADVFYGHLFRHGKEKPPDVRDAAYGLHLATQKLREQGRGFQSWVPFVHYGI